MRTLTRNADAPQPALAAFGNDPGAGIWALKNGTAWRLLHGATPELMVTGR
jgi:hypothetical protein